MSFKITEQFIQGKSIVAAECEDRIVANSDFVCVIDGATSKSHMSFNNKKQGVIAGEIIENIFTYLAPGANVYDFIEEVNKRYNNFYTLNNLSELVDVSPVDRLCASVIVYSDCRKELWLIGDCQAVIDDKIINNKKLVDSLMSDLRAFIIDLSINQGISPDELLIKDIGREEILPYIRKQMYFQNNYYNSIYSYAVLDGYPVDQLQIKVISVVDANNLVLATDGYPKIFKSLEESETYLKYILEKDPLCYKIFKSTKGLLKDNFSYDDRAYVKLELLRAK